MSYHWSPSSLIREPILTCSENQVHPADSKSSEGTALQSSLEEDKQLDLDPASPRLALP